MRRALFAREFRSALVPNLVTVGAILVTLVAVERLYGLRLGKAVEVHGFIDIVLLAGLVVSGFISGERCFPAGLKESRILFLSSLPISRTWAWLAIVSARLLAALASIALAVALRRPLLMPPYSEKFLTLGIAVAFSAYLFFFSAGTLFALLFRRTFVSYIAGFAFLGFLLTETVFSSTYATNLPALPLLSINPTHFADSVDVLLLFGCLSLFLFLAFLLSWRFFVRGEIGNPKRWIQNQFLFGATVAAYLALVFCAASSTKLASAWSTWEPFGGERLNFYIDVLETSPYGVSPNGRYLFAAEPLRGRPFIVRVSIVDIQTGHITCQSVYKGVGWVYWAGQGDVLNLVVLNNSPLDRWGYLVKGTVDWIRISPEGREISKLRLKGVEEVQLLGKGRALAALREGSLGLVNLLDGTSGQSSTVVHAPLDGYVTIRKDGPAALVYFKNVLLPRRAWVINSLAQEVRLSSSPLEPVYVLFGEAFGSPDEAQAAMLRRFAPPLTSEGVPARGSFLLPSPNQNWNLASRSDVKAVYFLDQRDPDATVLWARSTASGGHWENLPNIFPKAMKFPKEFLPSYIDFSLGVGAFPSKDDVGQFFIYDPRLGVTFHARSCASGDRAFFYVSRVLGLRGLLITLTCSESASSFPEQTRYFEHLPGSRGLLPIKKVSARTTYLPPHLYLDEQGLEVWMSARQQIEIWLSSPGRKDLRLWPPR